LAERDYYSPAEKSVCFVRLKITILIECYPASTKTAGLRQ
jgi:hypothetical protein